MRIRGVFGLELVWGKNSVERLFAIKREIGSSCCKEELAMSPADAFICLFCCPPEDSSQLSPAGGNKAAVMNGRVSGDC